MPRLVLQKNRGLMQAAVEYDTDMLKVVKLMIPISQASRFPSNKMAKKKTPQLKSNTL